VIISGQGIIYIALTLLLEPGLYALGYLWLRSRHYPSIRLWRFDRSIATSLLIHSLPFILVAVFTAAYSRIDQIMLKHMIDASAVGLYDAAVRIAEIWLFVPGLIASVLFPAIIHGKKVSPVEYRNRLLALSGITILFSITIALIFSLLATPITLLLYGKTYIQSGAVLQIYVWSSVFAALDSVLRFHLLAEHMYKTVLFLTASVAATNIILNLVLIPTFGITGAAWATLLAYTLLSYPLWRLAFQRVK
jgi:PST family polysaccharide transporter